MAIHQRELDPDFRLPPLATTFDKLEALDRDSLAGFLPTTHEEKNQAFEMLDYLGNPQYKAGVGNRLQEIFIRQRGLGGPAEARRALISVTNEYGDYLTGAIEQVEALRALDAVISDCPNPAISLVEEAGADHPGLPLLVRYKDLKELRVKGYKDDMEFDPLHTVENRKKPAKGKNKKLEDPYTASQMELVVATHISEELDKMTIGSTRQLVKESVIDQEHRRDFWLNILRGTKKHGAAWIVGKQILASLGYEAR